MAIKYKVRKQVFKIKGEKKPIYFARTESKGVTSMEELETMVSKISSASEGDVRSVLRTLSDLICHSLRDGRIVDLGDIGRLRIRLKSKHTDSREDFLQGNIRNIGVVFTPSVRIKKAISTAHLEVIDEKKVSTASDTGVSPQPSA